MAMLLLFLPAIASAQLAESTFAAGTEGWLSVIMPYPSAVPVSIIGVYTPNWVASGGGYLSMNDPDGSNSVGNCEYWQAPAAFLGARGAAYGGTLAFDIGNGSPGYGTFTQEDLILVGGGITMVAMLPSTPTSSLGHFAITLTETGWKRDGLGGPAATRAEFEAVLADITHLFIRAEYQLGPDTEYLDNVVMTSGTSGVGLPAGARFALGRCAPNPFNPTTAVTLDVAQPTRIRVVIVDALGRVVRHLRDESLEGGAHRLAWDGTDDGGQRAPSGVYFWRASAGAEVRTQRMVLLK